MKRMVSRHSLLAAISIAALTLASTPAALAHHSQAGTIKLGFFGPLSAGSAAAGQDMLNAMKLAVNIANKAGGVLGEQITIDAQDDQCTAQLSVTAAQKLVTDGVIGVVGGYCSGATIPASTIYHRAGIPIITPAATNPRLTAQGYSDVFRTIGRDDFQGIFAAKLMNSLHAKSVAIVHDNTTYAKGLATYTQAALQKMFPSIKVVFFDAITPGSKDFTGILTKIKSLKPDATYFTGYYADGGLFVKQFEQLGVGGQIMAGDGNNSPQFISLAGKAAEKAIVTGAPIPQFVPTAASFVKQFTAAYGIAPGAYSAYTYDATNVMLHAISVAKTTDAAALVKAVAATKNFQGVTGPITFVASGDRLQIQYIAMTVKNGQFVRWSM